MKLYDMKTDEWRKGNFKRGDHWRSKQIYKCVICGAETNNWVMGGYSGTGPRLLCPGNLYTNHDTLEEFLWKIETVEKRIKDLDNGLAKEDNPMERSQLIWIIENHRKVLKILIREIEPYKRSFSKKDDIKGIMNTKPIPFNPNARIASPKKKLEVKNEEKKKKRHPRKDAKHTKRDGKHSGIQNRNKRKRQKTGHTKR